MMDPRYILKVERAGLAGGLHMKGEGRRGVKNDSKTSDLGGCS